MEHVKFALHVAIAMAVINRISFVKALTSESSTPII
jgi:hypothetical protein